MSEWERERAFLVRPLVEKQLKQGAVAERLGVSVRQVKRLVRRWRESGDKG